MSLQAAFKPRRSVLYMPGSNARVLEKAKSIAADCIIFDLEDAVAPEAKAAARKTVADAVAGGGYGYREVVVRPNALSTSWGLSDLEAVIDARPDAVLMPKVSSEDEVYEIEEALNRAGANSDISLWVMIETPLAILNIASIAKACRTTRLSTFVAGTNDLVKDLHAAQTIERAPLVFSLSAIVTAARAYGLSALDGVYNDIQDEAGLTLQCDQGACMGFDGKTLIHPSQVGICNRIFSPTEDEVRRSKDVVAAFDSPENAGKGVIKVNGKMTELLHLEDAKRVIAIADAIAGRQMKPA